MPISMSTTVLNVGTLATTTSDPATKAQLISLQSELAQHAQDFETERNALIAQNTASQATVTSLNAQIAALGADAAVKANTIADLQRRIATVPAPTVAKPQDIATSFKSVMDQIQSQARSSPVSGTTLKSMDIEIKGVVQVQSDNTPVLVFPAAGSVDSQTLSTMRMSFAAVPTAPAPATSPAPAPSPSLRPPA